MRARKRLQSSNPSSTGAGNLYSSLALVLRRSGCAVVLWSISGESQVRLIVAIIVTTLVMADPATGAVSIHLSEAFAAARVQVKIREEGFPEPLLECVPELEQPLVAGEFFVVCEKRRLDQF